MNRIKTAIVGASGYSGMELLRLLLGHPGVELVAVTSRQEAGKALGGGVSAVSQGAGLGADVHRAGSGCDRGDRRAGGVSRAAARGGGGDRARAAGARAAGDRFERGFPPARCGGLSRNFTATRIRRRICWRRRFTACRKSGRRKSRPRGWWHRRVVIRRASCCRCCRCCAKT